MGSSPWGRKELDRTEATEHTHTQVPPLFPSLLYTTLLLGKTYMSYLGKIYISYLFLPTERNPKRLFPFI